jgi:hypothetical protein
VKLVSTPQYGSQGRRNVIGYQGEGMTHRERFVRTLTGQPVDRVPFIVAGANSVSRRRCSTPR